LKQFAFASGILKLGSMDLFGNVEAILNSTVSKSYYGMLGRQMHTNLPAEHPIIAIPNNRIQNGCRIAKKVHCNPSSMV